MNNRWISILSLAFFSSVVYSQTFYQGIYDQELLAHGKNLYMSRCSGCHGIEGNGKGEAFSFLDPKPRDFTKGIFKFRSTPLGSLPSDQDLMKTITKGILGTSMPSFADVPEVSRLAVIQYIKSFSKEWDKKESFSGPVQGAAFPREDFLNHSKFMKRAENGRRLFKENCLVCHGRTGEGNGSGSEGLEDDWGNPIKPANLTQSYIKSGKSVADIYRVVLTGVGGTPMPSFKDTISDTELWDVTAYVLYLRGKAAGVYSDQSPIKEITKEEAEE